jgi:acetyl esterase
VPSWFLIGEQDRIIPAELQRYMAERAGARRTTEIPTASRDHRLAARGHGPAEPRRRHDASGRLSTASRHHNERRSNMHMSITTHAPVVLEHASKEFVEATSTPPFLYELTPAEARKVLDDVQAAPIDKLPVEDRWITVPAEVGDVRVRIIRPPDAVGTLPVILYMHGGGWVLGNADTHDRLVRELAVGTGAAVVFLEYDRSPEAHYPVAIEQGYATGKWIVREGAANQLDPDRIAVAGDSVGGGMTAALALMANERGDVRFVQQSMYYPVTDARMDTGSYEQFAEGYFLTAKAMAWFWDAYLPDLERRSEPFASPLRATDEQLAGLPPAFVIVDEADVLRDEGEAYAARLRAAGVPVTTVRYDGITHDFMMLNPLSGTHATRAAVAQAIAVLRQALHSA